MRRSPYIAGALSLLVPGLGQIYAGESDKGAAITAGAIIIGNLNIIVLPLIALANPASPKGAFDKRSVWAYWIPRVVHDIASVWSVTFWFWAILDAVSVCKRKQ